jgi:hypothetical protein
MPTLSQKTLLTCLEDYLKREGLLTVIPSYRRQRLFQPSMRVSWVAWLVLVPVAALWGLGDVHWLLALLVPPGMVAALFVMTEAAAATWFCNWDVDQKEDLVVIRLVLITPAALAATVGVFLESFWAAALVLTVFVAGMAGLLVLRHQAGRMYTVWSQARLAAQMIGRSLKLATILMPLLLVFVLFSVFSQEIWQVLAALKLHQAVGGFVLLSIPALLYARANFKVLVRDLTRPRNEAALRERLHEIGLIEDNLRDGFISPEEVDKAHEQLVWRDLRQMGLDVFPSIRRRLRLLLYLLAACMTGVLWATFGIYFFALFYTLIPDAVAAEWARVDGKAILRTFEPLPGIRINWMAVHVAELKTAAALGGLLAILANVYALAEEGIRKSMLAWLTPQVEQWQAAGLYYRSLLPRNLQVWGQPDLDPRTGYARVTAVTPPGLDKEAIERACKELRAELDAYPRVKIDVYPRTESFSGETSGWWGEWWSMRDDRSAGQYHFVEFSAVQNQLRNQHMLGQQLHERGEEIADEWFGDTPECAAVGRSIWNLDLRRPHPVVLHPYVRRAGEVLTVEVRLKKRLARHKDHESLLSDLLTAITGADTESSEVHLTLLYRDRSDSILSLEWSREQGRRSYRDALGRIVRNQRVTGSWTSVLSYFSRN